MIGLRQRPENFRMNYGHSLAKRLVFAGLGQKSGSVRYVDSSPYGTNGTLVGIPPATGWTFLPSLGRFSLLGSGSSQYVQTTKSGLAPMPLTASCWIKNTDTPATFDMPFANVSSGWGAGWGFSWGNPYFNCWVSGVYARVSYTMGTNAFHAAMTFVPNMQRLYMDGIYAAQNTLASILTDPSDLRVCGGNGSADRSWPGHVADAMVWNRVLSDHEIQQLADPSNVMLSGLILPPKRKYYALRATTTYSNRFFSFKTPFGSLSLKS